MGSLPPDVEKIAACGLYCGACRRHLAGKCPGCAGNEQAWWCKIRTCVTDKGITSCAECREHPTFVTCKRLNNLPAKIIALLLDSDRPACLRAIRDDGPRAYAQRMAALRRQSLPRKRS